MSDFKIVNKQITFNTEGPISFVDLSEQINQVVEESKIKNGMVHVFAPHATGVLILTENDPDAL